jgi:hypothetical protein
MSLLKGMSCDRLKMIFEGEFFMRCFSMTGRPRATLSAFSLRHHTSSALLLYAVSHDVTATRFHAVGATITTYIVVPIMCTLL